MDIPIQHTRHDWQSGKSRRKRGEIKHRTTGRVLPITTFPPTSLSSRSPSSTLMSLGWQLQIGDFNVRIWALRLGPNPFDGFRLNFVALTSIVIQIRWSLFFDLSVPRFASQNGRQPWDITVLAELRLSWASINISKLPDTWIRRSSRRGRI